MAFTNLLISTCAILLLLNGCATQSTIPASVGEGAVTQKVPTAQVETPSPEKKAKPAEGSFEPDTLYALLVAELAGQRKRYDMLLSNYLHQARKTRDPGIAERATRIAIYLKADKAALAAAMLWAEAAPEDTNAQQLLAIQLIKAGQFEQAMTLLEAIQIETGEANFEYLAASTKDLNQSERNKILTHFDRLLGSYPNNTKLLFGKTILLQINGRGDDALKTANALYELKPDTRNQLLRIRLLHQLGKTKEALKLLTQSLQEDPADKQVRLLYAQLLIDTKALPAAYKQFSILVEQNPWDSQLRLTLALLAMENNQPDEAKLNLTLLLRDDRFAQDAHYYLAQLAEQQQPEEAITHYQQVISGDKAISAHAQMGKLLLMRQQKSEMQQIFRQSRIKNPDNSENFYMLEADLLAKYGYAQDGIQLLTEALNQFPADINLLYARAMAAEKTNDLEAMEHDLRIILGKEPDNANVLNALGYALADRTDRYHEALELISRAAQLKPNDPAITDSLGWALFRLGNYQEAIKLLEKALAEFPDHEVAAHLGEVLWATGQYERAQQIWDKALESKPDSLIIKRVLERLNPEQLK